MPVQQIYCTHCTYGTSALEQREGELAERVLGYSARAGSLDRAELRNDYRAIERFLYYYLPSDTPPEEKQRLDAASAPRRLFFCPAMGKLQMVGQVAYRQYDTAGRLGSYFAHVLFGDKSNPWSAADCLRLWGAPWVEEDALDLPYSLPAFESIDAVWAGKTPTIGDEAVLNFLQPNSGAEGDQSILTDRWRTAPAAQRIDLLVNALQGLLALGLPRRENILLVVEPSVAALVFYAVARLLPRSLSEGLSFSTYEPNAERLPVTLAATVFFDPYTTDVRSDLYRRRGLVINTFVDRMSESGKPPGDYARFIVEKLLEEGWQTVDRLLAGFETAGAKRPEDLELLAHTHPLVLQVLSATTPADDSWRRSEVAVRYLSQELQHQLATAPAGWPQLHRVLGTPNHLTVLELIASDRLPPEIQRPAQFLLKKFDPGRIAELVNSPLVARSAKIEALVSYITAQSRLPDGCQLLKGDTRLKARPTSEGSLLTEVLVKLPEPVLYRVSESIGDGERMEFFGALLDACRGPTPPPSVKKLVLEMISRFSDNSLLDALVKHREQIVRVCSPPEPVLARRLERLLYDLPKYPKNFEKWLAVLNDWKGSFSFPHLAERRLSEWNKFRSCLLSLREPDDTAATKIDRIKKRLRSPPRAEYKPLAEALARAMPRRTTELDELAAVADQGVLSIPQFTRRLELAARQAGLAITFDENAGAATSVNETVDDRADEVGRLQRRREQQARMLDIFQELQQRLLVYEDDALGTRKLAVLQQVGQLVVGRPDFLGEGRPMVEAYFSNNGAWTGLVLSSNGKTKHGFKYRVKRRHLAPYLVVGILAAILVPLAGIFALRGRNSPVAVATNSADKPPPPTSAMKTAAESGTAKPKRIDGLKTDGAATIGSTEPSSLPEKAKNALKNAAPRRLSNSNPANPSSTDASPTAEKDPSPPDAPTEDSLPSAEKPSDGEKPPVNGEARTTMPDKATPEDDAPPTTPDAEPDQAAPGPDAAGQTASAKAAVVVREFHSLPLRGATFSQRISLKKWSTDPGSITLTLKGLSAANQRLGGKNRLVAEARSDGLAVALETSTKPAGAPSTVAMFTTANNELSFQWADNGQVVESVEAARRQLRRCVLEVGTASDTSSISLAAPIKREPLGLKIGVAKLELRPLNNSEIQFDADDELMLGRGYLLFSDSPALAFGDRDHLNASASLQQLPEAVRDSHAQVVLWRNEKDPFDCELLLTADTTALPDGLKPLSDDERKTLSTLREILPKLNNLLGRPRWWQDQQQSGAVESHVQKLGKALHIANVPTRAGAAPPGDPKDYAAAIRLQIIEPAQQRRDALAQRVRHVDAFRKTQQSQLKILVTRAVTVTAQIYRRIEGDTFAPCLMLGDPENMPVEIVPAYNNAD